MAGVSSKPECAPPEAYATMAPGHVCTRAGTLVFRMGVPYCERIRYCLRAVRHSEYFISTIFYQRCTELTVANAHESGFLVRTVLG
mmetsp:Transcript_27035/g.81836  ORF Transcript_27035/g.81836 Transcript_27035/m.81836 type:complete len:86 (+) Transcript_27035:897-1154(+)